MAFRIAVQCSCSVGYKPLKVHFCAPILPASFSLLAPAITHTIFSQTNVINAGESGIGKSSPVDLITGQGVGQTSDDATACTLRTASHRFSIDGHDFVLWDTPGFDEGSMTVINARFPEVMVRTLVQRLKNAGGIDLVYWMHGNRAKTGLVNSYKFIRSLVPTTVPFVAVVTRLERYPNQMEDWWAKNEHELSNFGMEFVDHACITAPPGSSTLPASFCERLTHSRTTVQDLIRTNCCPYAISPTLASFPSRPTTDD
ncbi:hypothetical protein HYDPIDRAFT_30881 [Hydnomerulius pinastri MD-312]|uniref:G domain-containing protein n=1 Tax=Hydnomerulius pinastri MD-312 TaxID=994086 RepID=A0A0C9W589_9AGAM|nr:hypothetical protein HYDPIDRAFT_30881 [Hydnomerulius pinastri MD-312]